MNSWYQRRKHDYEVSAKKVEWLKQLKRIGFIRINKEISICIKRCDEALRSMDCYNINR
ncbi:hypothetical protein [Lacrimispora brassicae]